MSTACRQGGGPPRQWAQPLRAEPLFKTQAAGRAARGPRPLTSDKRPAAGMPRRRAGQPRDELRTEEPSQLAGGTPAAVQPVLRWRRCARCSLQEAPSMKGPLSLGGGACRCLPQTPYQPPRLIHRNPIPILSCLVHLAVVSCHALCPRHDTHKHTHCFCPPPASPPVCCHTALSSSSVQQTLKTRTEGRQAEVAWGG